MASTPPGQGASWLPPSTLGLGFPEQLLGLPRAAGVGTAQVPPLPFACPTSTSCIVFDFG